MPDANTVVTADFRETPWWWHALPDAAFPGGDAQEAVKRGVHCRVIVSAMI
jgi:hypothetical protein